jgi:hypothetical protein
MKRTIAVPTSCTTSDVLINPWCKCVVAMVHGIHARNNTAMCTLGTPPGCVNSRYLWDLTNNQTHFRTQPAIPNIWCVSVEVTTWFRGSRPHETVVRIQFVSWLQHKVPVKTRENRIIKKLVCAVPGMTKSVQLLWVRQAAIAPGNGTTLPSH